jgi:hypothetical protein
VSDISRAGDERHCANRRTKPANCANGAFDQSRGGHEQYNQRARQERFGGLLMGIGTVITMWPSPLERRAPAYALGGVEVPAE